MRNNYNKPGHPIAFSGINTILNYYQGILDEKKLGKYYQVLKIILYIANFTKTKETRLIPILRDTNFKWT